MNKIKAARQGEVLIFRISDDEYERIRTGNAWGRKKLDPVPVPENVIREGEKSGHKHAVSGQAQLSMFGDPNQGTDRMVIEVGKEGGEITHPEHGPIKLSEGKYEVKIQQEFEGMGKKRKTAD
ncbi:MAG: hypothetical protein RBT11_19680 [Desulfobacterales bacterium]|nr:hypothetical protein [Desulfobacterales bacterium]